MKYILLSTLCSLAVITNLNAQELPPVAEDEVGIVETLPRHYPDSYIFTSAIGFPQSGSIAVVDVAAETDNYKGSINAGYNADFLTNVEKGEFYVSETYYSRGSRGVRTDIISVIDQETLKLKHEIPLEVRKRFLVMPMTGKFSFTNDKKWVLVSNYTPATSVSVVDLESQKVISEIAIPGCNLAYSMGKRGFATMCGFGEVISITLDEKGELLSEHSSEPFNDIDSDPHFEKVARIDDIIYIPTYKGSMTSIDLSGDQAIVGETWSLVSAEEREQGWRPGGWSVISKDNDGNFYILMHEKGYNGSHKDLGTEVWVFDPKTKTRIARHKLKAPANAIVVTKEKEPHLAAFSPPDDMLRVYRADNGEYVRPIMIGKMVGTMYVPE